jgi:hypothetical protein
MEPVEKEGGKPVSELHILGVDLAKRTFAACCCNQVEMSPVLQSRNVTKCAEGSKAFEPGDFNYRRAEKPCGDQ